MTLIEEFKDPVNKLYISTYGAIFALGFCGKQDFIDRSYNMCVNHGIANGELKCLEDGFYYCLTTKAKLANGLKEYLINEIKYNKEIPLLKDICVEEENEDGSINVAAYCIEYNEPEIEKLAETRVIDILDNYITPKNFMANLEDKISNDFYEIAHDRRNKNRSSVAGLISNISER